MAMGNKIPSRLIMSKGADLFTFEPVQPPFFTLDLGPKNRDLTFLFSLKHGLMFSQSYLRFNGPLKHDIPLSPALLLRYCEGC